MKSHGPKPEPADVRPYRAASQPGDELCLHTADRVTVFRQIGWHGQTGAFYALDEQPHLYEPGSFSPVWIIIDSYPGSP